MKLNDIRILVVYVVEDDDGDGNFNIRNVDERQNKYSFIEVKKKRKW